MTACIFFTLNLFDKIIKIITDMLINYYIFHFIIDIMKKIVKILNMRVISGKSRGTKIETIDEDTTRPTLDRVKESLFNIIQGRIQDSVILDLFAGSGALGIEALSRGAKKAYFCDANKSATDIVKKNLKKTHLEENAIVYNCDYKKFIEKTKDSIEFDIIFLDPPYKMDLAVSACEELIDRKLVRENGIIIIETDEFKRDNEEIKIKLKDKATIVDKRKYGRANLIFLELKHNEAKLEV